MSSMDVDVKRRTKQPKDENKPKAPLSGYFRYANEHRPVLKEEYPDLKMTELAKKISEMWQNLSDSKKKPYVSAYQAERVKYNKKMEAYKKSSDYQDHQEALKEFKMKQTKKPFGPDPNAPKRPISSFVIFCNEKRAGVMAKIPGQPATAAAAELGKLWKKCSESDKEKYKKKAAKLKKDYDAAFEKYKKTKKYTEYIEAKEEYKKKQEATRIKLLGGKRAIAKAEEEKRIAEGRPLKKKVSGKKKKSGKKDKMARKPKKSSAGKRRAEKRKKSGGKKARKSTTSDKKKKSSGKKTKKNKSSGKKKKASKKKKAGKAGKK